MGGGAFIAPHRNVPVGGVGDLNMSGLEAGHVWPRSLEPGLGTGQVQPLGLNQGYG
jgi:hypothetical protein